MLSFDFTGCLRADHHTQAKRQHYQQALSLCADWLGRFLVGVNLPCHEEEIVANAVQHDADDDHPAKLIRRADGKQTIPSDPRQHPDGQHPFHAKPGEEERHNDHEKNLGDLAVRHGGADGQLNMLHNSAGDLVVERQRDTDQHR